MPKQLPQWCILYHIFDRLVAYVMQTGDQTRKHGPEAFRLDVLSVRARMRQQTFLLMHLGVPSRPLRHVHAIPKSTSSNL